MNDVIEFVVKNWPYLAVGGVSAMVVGTCYALWDDDGRNDGVVDGLGLIMCVTTFALWPAVFVAAGIVTLCALIAAAWRWFEKHELHPMTWVFAWPYKTVLLIRRWRFRRKVRKMIETGDTRIVEEDTGEVEKEQE